MGEAKRKKIATVLREKRARESCLAAPSQECRKWQPPGWCHYPYVPIAPPKPSPPVERSPSNERPLKRRILMTPTAALLAIIASMERSP